MSWLIARQCWLAQRQFAFILVQMLTPLFLVSGLVFGEATFHMVQKGPGIKNHLPQRNCGFKVVTHLGSNEVCRSLRTLTRWEVSYVGFGRYPGHPAQALQVRTKSDSIQKATRKPKWMGKRL